MPSWRRRVLVYRVIGAVPGAASLLDSYRVRFGSVGRMDLDLRLQEVAEMLHLLRAADFVVDGKDLVEIGSGWHPLMAVIFFGMGARSVLMTDIDRHMHAELAQGTVRYCIDHAAELAEMTGSPEADLRLRWSSLVSDSGSWTDSWQSQGLSYRAPFDLSRDGLPGASVDLVFSNSCLNYIPVDVLKGVMAGSSRALRSGGGIAHSIHVYDDLAGHDPSITPWNFLDYSEAEWQRIGNSRLHHQNRLRPRAYADLAVANGLTVRYDERVLLPVDIDQIDRSILDPTMRDLPAEEIACSHYLLAAEKAGDTDIA